MTKQTSATTKAPVTFNAGGKACRLKYTINAMIALEDQFDKAFGTIIAELQSATRLGVLRDVFAAGLLIEGEKASVDAAAAVIEEIGLEATSLYMADALGASAGPKQEPGK